MWLIFQLLVFPISPRQTQSIFFFYRNYRVRLNAILLLQLLLHLNLFKSANNNCTNKAAINWHTEHTYYLTLSILSSLTTPKNTKNSYKLYLKSNHNNLMHTYNGNRNKVHGYTIMNLNKVNALFATKLYDIQICIQTGLGTTKTRNLKISPSPRLGLNRPPQFEKNSMQV